MKERKIERTQNFSRGYGRMTVALFRSENCPMNCNGWDYVEVIYPTTSGHQRACHDLETEDARKLIGADVNDIKALGFYILGGKWHTPKISKKGVITSLIS
ncbi:MAG: hypothetical protein ACTSXG_01595 [Alphaproteobacteria bacterium]